MYHDLIKFRLYYFNNIILLFTSLTTIGFNFMSFGRAAITSFFVKPFKTGIKNRTSETLV